MVRELKPALAIALLVVVLLAPLGAQNAGVSSQAPADESVPADLRALVAPAQSEMRLVTQRYSADRVLLAGNYQGGGDAGRGGGGRGGGPAAGASGSVRPPVSVSPNRIARLKRFDLDWQAALARIDAAHLSPGASNELETLKASVQSNLAQLDAETAAIAELAPLVPFAPRIIALYESRVRMEDVDAQRAAGEVTAIAKEVAQVRARLEAGLNGATGSEGLQVGRDQATRGADATDSLRASLANWFAFFNGYDPVFTWWMGMPYKQADGALLGYAASLREKVAAADRPASPAPAVRPIAPAAAPKFAEVPDLAELLALPRDEMAAVVQRFTGRPSGGRGGEPVIRSPKYYQDWLAALKTIDFDKLSRNAQVNYVFIRTTSEMQIARARTPTQADIPRKTDNTGITGEARGRVGLLQDLADEMIPYTPEELIALGYKELAWLEGEMRKASAQMGYGDDWKKAIEKVKTMHPPPGGQPAAIRDMLFEAVDYLRAHDMITVPQVAAESLRMNMMSPERQLINPFFTGGAQITVSYPTDTMEYETRLQSMRGNNVPFSHATAFHEMIPGHNLAFYVGQRYAGYRASLGSTPFYGEGWALYWEIILFDKGFHDTPEERFGALFWRMHRAARIIFSMNFHLGQWSPQECIDFLVERVGHERDNATAEVRRSFQQAAPLYQAAYLLGGLQIRSMRNEMVESGQMTEKQFHDEIMRQGSMPIAWLRLSMSKQPLKPDSVVSWKFYGDIAAK
jgi:Bacterial protein of unknown function (DUF885)